MQITVETLIHASRETAFRVATDIPRWPELISAIKRIEMLTPGPVAPGTQFRETRKMFGREASEVMTVASLQPPELLILTAENHGTRYRAAHTFMETDAGTRLMLTFEGRPVSLMARLMMPLGLLMKGHVKRQLVGELSSLKAAIETTAVN